jgi:hypothetical protein
LGNFFQFFCDFFPIFLEKGKLLVSVDWTKKEIQLMEAFGHFLKQEKILDTPPSVRRLDQKKFSKSVC